MERLRPTAWLFDEDTPKLYSWNRLFNLTSELRQFRWREIVVIGRRPGDRRNDVPIFPGKGDDALLDSNPILAVELQHDFHSAFASFTDKLVSLFWPPPAEDDVCVARKLAQQFGTFIHHVAQPGNLPRQLAFAYVNNAVWLQLSDADIPEPHRTQPVLKTDAAVRTLEARKLIVLVSKLLQAGI